MLALTSSKDQLMKTIAVIDKHPVVRAGLEIFIKNNFNEVTIIEFDSFYYFNKVNIDTAPELFIVGNTVELPSQQCSLIMKLKEKNPSAKLIIYDDNPDFLKVSQFVKSGVTGYVTKRSEMTELLNCIAEIQKGKNYFGNDILEVLIPKWATPVDASSQINRITLTHREFEIANYLINGDTVAAISKKLHREVSTIRAIKKNLFNKLKITNLVDLRDSLQKSLDQQVL